MFKLYRTEFDLCKDGIPFERWEDYWQATHPDGLAYAQERAWKLVNTDYSIANFVVEECDYKGVWPPQAHIIEFYEEV